MLVLSLGLPPVHDIFCEAVVALGTDYPLKFGPSHIVWEDENFDDVAIEFCLAECEHRNRYLIGDEEVKVVVTSLRRLLAVPVNVRLCQPADYDGVNPAQFPPPTYMEMVR